MSTIEGSAASGARDAGALEPSLKLSHLYALLVFTLGLYAAPWAYRISKDLPRHPRQGLPPLLAALIAILPGANLYVFYEFSERVHASKKGNGLKIGMNTREILGLAGLITVLQVINLGYFYTGSLDAVLVVMVILQGLLSPIPILLIHSECNSLKISLFGASRSPRRLLIRHRAAMAFVPVVALIAFVGTHFDQLMTPAEPYLQVGARVSGESQGYFLTVPDGTWFHMPAGRRATDADLELSGRNGNAALFVFAYCDGGSTLDDLVTARRKENSGRLSNFEAFEERRFDVASFAPVSTTKYSGTGVLGRRETYWVSAAIDNGFVVEVLINLFGEEPDDLSAVGSFLQSLEILGGEKECGSG